MLTVIIKSQFGYILILNAELDEQYLLNNKVENNNNTIWAFALKKTKIYFVATWACLQGVMRKLSPPLFFCKYLCYRITF